ncbi:HPt (histidine-containing phosphotransfer) domain-containing protein [Sphingobacterium nematocida]|uniref:HPt (Histidine-containing phosphotransfer) domain-containing protein n=1 Tax=Sphingobacterium nematocida TaxID=1513896 RepID=A0A1T5FVC0_9SPHI|nr:Hpt domain-containing protein [Sphingobacterium nematocida]SKC00119.1 HPt (histidine-containing phosphotransfer) domain-containing protein [Sphingobacterium nematocida]
MNYKIIKPETIHKSMMGNSEMIKQFIAIYLQQSPIDFQTLELSFTKNDIRAIGDNAHHIKPTMEYIGASSLRMAFQDLENMSKSNLNIELIQEKFEEIKPIFQLMIEELNSFSKEIEDTIKE